MESPLETLPPPGPRLHSGLFREQTLRDVCTALELLRAEASKPSADSRETILEVLDHLADYVVDLVVLEKTSVGQEMAKLTKHADKDIAQKAEELKTEWRRDYSLRKQVVEGFIEKGSLKRKDARDLEEGLFNSACPLGLLEGEGKKNYQRHYKRLCTHLRTRGVGSLAHRLAEGTLRFLEVASLPDDALLSDEQQQQQRSDKEAGLKAAVQAPQEPQGALTHDYACGKCGSDKCSRQEVQTGWHNDQRDLTIFVSCMGCGHRWKESDDHGLAGS
eukprot:TRINITY_DN22888_c0_g1_i1.p1 TRINITY_DN22888_c0_g1~~TRINITY_DN22888_c0_g1_i1.p1  ORF type:complete len:287 (-),score=57.51 TRINITY_DN22888_c0_g1_i1:59-883(-)